MAYIRNVGESTKDWLERLITIDAPESIRGIFQTILENENRMAVGGKN